MVLTQDRLHNCFKVQKSLHQARDTWQEQERKCHQVGRRYCIGQETSHAFSATGNGTTKCQGVGAISWGECSQGISACC